MDRMENLNINKLDDISRQKMMSIFNCTQPVAAYSVKVYRVDGERGNLAKMPAIKTLGSSGYDLHAAEAVTVPPMGRALIRTGLIFECPNIRWEIQIRSRSGLALKNGVFVLNSPGTIDADYRGEIGIILFNTTQEPFEVSIGDRIAQAVIIKLSPIAFEEADGKFSDTVRGDGGFGSTGV